MNLNEDILDTLLATSEFYAQLLIVLEGQDLYPTWAMINQKYDPLVHSTPWNSWLEKRLAAAFIKHELARHKAIAYSFVTEAWQAKEPKEGEPWHGASEVPDRQEIVVAFATDGTTTKWRRWKMIRDGAGKVTELTAIPTPSEDEGSFETWMTGLLA